MARVYGEHDPERPLMGVISDLLGIEHFTTSRGSTVRRDFLEAVCRGLGIPATTAASVTTKDDVLSLAVQTATGQPMRVDWFSPGYTVTNEVLQVIADGITRNGVPGRPAVPDIPAEEVADDGDGLEFDPADIKDERDRRLVELATRQAQDKFRTALLDAYDGKCAITGSDAPETLQAAHIFPYQGVATNRVTNGLLLRSDMHLLFDRGAISVDESTFTVLVKPHLLLTTYADLFVDAVSLRLPRLRGHRPSAAALRSHREWAGF